MIFYHEGYELNKSLAVKTDYVFSFNSLLVFNTNI